MVRKQVQDFDGYYVSDDGSVWTRWKTESLGRGMGSRAYLSDDMKRLKASPHKASGYPRVVLHRDGKSFHRYVHSLVLTAFAGPKPDGKECRHLDGNKLNCALTNLTWGTPKENTDDKYDHGTVLYGENNPASKLTDDEVTLIRDALSIGISQRKIAKSLGVTQSHVSSINTGRRR